MESVDEGMFTGCTALEYTEIPASVTSVDSRAFAGCYARDPMDKELIQKHCMNATKIDISGTELKDSPSETGSKLKSRTFCGRKALREVYLPDDTYQYLWTNTL